MQSSFLLLQCTKQLLAWLPLQQLVTMAWGEVFTPHHLSHLPSVQLLEWPRNYLNFDTVARFIVNWSVLLTIFSQGKFVTFLYAATGPLVLLPSELSCIVAAWSKGACFIFSSLLSISIHRRPCPVALR